MRINNRTKIDGFTKPRTIEETPESGYSEWLAAEIEEGQAEPDEGQGVAAIEVWKALDLE